MRIDHNGNVTLKFNKKIMVPNIKIQSEEANEQEQEEKKSGIVIPEIELEEFMNVYVVYDDDYFEGLNKSILSYAPTYLDE